MPSRRVFIKSGAITTFGIGMLGIPAFLTRAANRSQLLHPYKKNKILVCIFQRGAMDGLMAVTPFTDQYLQAARPALFMSPAKNSRITPLIDLDGRFGLHPGMGTFAPLFMDKQLAVVHGIGSPNNSRSHFEAQDYMESGTPFDKGTTTGWLNRATGLMTNSSSPLRAVSLTQSLPRSFYGYNSALAISSLQDFSIQQKGRKSSSNVTAKSFEELYDQATPGLLKTTAKETFDTVKILEKLDKNYQPANGAVYPVTAFGNSLKQIAQLIKMEVGLEIGFAESGGWDTHYNQGTEKGIFARNARDLSETIVAFWADIGESWQDDVTVVTMTEFGRTVKQNGSGGTDHGRASCTFILGHDVNGGMVHGEVKPLSVENLEDARDLAVTTDYRAVFSEVAETHLNLKNDGSLFPGWKGGKIGVMKA